MKILPFILLSLLSYNEGVLFENSISQKEYPWELKKEKDNIKVFIRESDESSVNEVRVIAEIEASKEDLVEIVYDIESYTKWVANIESSKVLEIVSDREIFYYFEAAVPWPFSNRDDIMHFEYEEDAVNNSVKITFKDRPDYLPEKKKVVRLRKNFGHWKFTSKQNGLTQLEYQFLTDPGKGNPAWLVNMFIIDGPYQTILNLKDYIDK